jgi:hypothetical protein
MHRSTFIGLSPTGEPRVNKGSYRSQHDKSHESHCSQQYVVVTEDLLPEQRLATVGWTSRVLQIAWHPGDPPLLVSVLTLP